MSKRVLGLINLYDSPSLGELTQNRTLGSTSFLGRFAIMDFTLSNFTNSYIDEVNILVKDNYRSVAKHVGTLKQWVNNTKIGRQNILMNEPGIRDPKLNSDLNAIRHNDWALYEAKADYVVIAPAHIITLCNYRDALNSHIKNNADLTVIYTKIHDGKKAFLTSNVLEVKDDKIVLFKPNKGEKDDVNVSLRTYIISMDAFQKILDHKDSTNAMSLRMLIEKLVSEQSLKVFGYEYKGYARCIDSFEHFIEYSFELLDYSVATQLFDQDWPVYTVSHNAPPTIYGVDAKVSNVFVANGSHIYGKVENSVISRHVVVGKKADVDHAIILTDTEVGDNVKLRYAVIDKYAKVYKDVIGTKDKPVYVPQGAVLK